MSATTGPLITYYPGQAPLQAPGLVEFRERVVADGGGVADEAACQNALNVLASLPQPIQWLDARFGVRNTQRSTWYSICGPQVDVTNGFYGQPVLGVDAGLGSQVWSGGSFGGSRTPRLPLTDDYTWGMRVYLSANAAGCLWGDFQAGSEGWWSYMLTEFWRSYDGAVDDSFSFALPRGSWFWLWCVKQGDQLVLYVNETELARYTLTHPIYEKSMGIAGGSDSFGQCDSGVRYQTFLRFAAALTPAQRAAVMAI